MKYIVTSKFEEYLISLGYKPQIHTKHGYIDADREHLSYSTMDILSIRYVNGDKEIHYGLHEHHHPPCLIWPRPKVRILRDIKCPEYSGIPFINKDDPDKNFALETEAFDRNIDILFQKESIEDIYNAIFDDSIIFKYDLRENENTIK